jgi:hypothetical protein
MKRFVERHLVTPEELPKYYAAIDAGVHFHDSIVPEMASDCSRYRKLVCLVSRGTDTPNDGRVLACVRQRAGLPVHPAALVYADPDLVLVLVSGLASQTHLPYLHPDRAGGLGFVGGSSLACAPLLFAHSVLLSGQIASRVFYNGGSLFSSELTILSYVFLSVLVVLAPLFLFTPQLIQRQAQRPREIWQLCFEVRYGF